jgi:hypothetical protein
MVILTLDDGRNEALTSESAHYLLDPAVSDVRLQRQRHHECEQLAVRRDFRISDTIESDVANRGIDFKQLLRVSSACICACICVSVSSACICVGVGVIVGLVLDIFEVVCEK